MYFERLSRRVGERTLKQLLSDPSCILQLVDELESENRKKAVSRVFAPINFHLKEGPSPSEKRSTSLNKRGLGLQTRSQVLRRLQLQSPVHTKRR